MVFHLYINLDVCDLSFVTSLVSVAYQKTQREGYCTSLRGICGWLKYQIHYNTRETIFKMSNGGSIALT
jgi:hypothetical protein